jgi:ABC-type Fe3+-hydroxamate transport system substrate-binding protein
VGRLARPHRKRGGGLRAPSLQPITALAAAAAALVLGATACGERSEPTGSTARLYPLTVQSGDRPLVVSGAASRIAVLDQPTEAILRALGAGGRIVGPAPANRIDFTALRRSHPDLIVAAESADERDLSRAAAITHAQVYTAPGGSIEQVERSITQLGLLTDTPVRARLLVRRIERSRRVVDARLANVPSVTVFVDTGFFTTVSDQSLIGGLIREAHGTNVAGSATQAGPVDSADLLQLDPDTYLATSDTGLTLADLRRNPRTRKLRAVREGRFMVADADLLQPGPEVGEGLAQIARLLHPNAFR